MIKTLFSKVSGNVYDGDHVDHVEVEQKLLDHSKDQDRTHEEELVEVRSEDQELGAIPLLQEEAEARPVLLKIQSMQVMVVPEAAIQLPQQNCHMEQYLVA